MSRVRAIAHLADGSTSEIDAATIDELLRDKECLLWLDIEDPSEEDVALLRQEFSFHELALEDALRGFQRPKLDEYDDYYFIVIYAAEVGPDGIQTHEVHCFWGKTYFITMHTGPVPEIDQAIQRWSAGQEKRQFGVAYQAYALLDAVIDGYFPIVDAIADKLEDVEERIFDGDQSLIREVFLLEKQLFAARRVLAPSRDVLNALIRRDVPVFPEALIPYLADVYDHAIRVMDTLDLHRDLLSSAIDTHLSVTSNRLNQTMRTLTAFTISLMFPTLVAGIYGMNFKYMPELDWPLGYPYALGLMVLSVVLLFGLFKRVGWL